MGQFFTAVFLIVFVLSLVYVVKKLLDSEKNNVKYRKFVIIPIKNDMADIAKTIKSAYWDNNFNNAVNEVLIYPLEPISKECSNILEEVCDELEGVFVVEKNKLEEYISLKS